MDINEARELLHGYPQAIIWKADDFVANKRAEAYVEAYDSQQVIIDKQREEIEGLKKLLERGLRQMQAINGADDRCVGNPKECLNHNWIHEAEEGLK